MLDCSGNEQRSQSSSTLSRPASGSIRSCSRLRSFSLRRSVGRLSVPTLRSICLPRTYQGMVFTARGIATKAFPRPFSDSGGIAQL